MTDAQPGGAFLWKKWDSSRRFGLVMWTWKPSRSRLDAAEALAVRPREWREEGKG